MSALGSLYGCLKCLPRLAWLSRPLWGLNSSQDVSLRGLMIRVQKPNEVTTMERLSLTHFPHENHSWTWSPPRHLRQFVWVTAWERKRQLFWSGGGQLHWF